MLQNETSNTIYTHEIDQFNVAQAFIRIFPLTAIHDLVGSYIRSADFRHKIDGFDSKIITFHQSPMTVILVNIKIIYIYPYEMRHSDMKRIVAQTSNTKLI